VAEDAGEVALLGGVADVADAPPAGRARQLHVHHVARALHPDGHGDVGLGAVDAGGAHLEALHHVLRGGERVEVEAHDLVRVRGRGVLVGVDQRRESGREERAAARVGQLPVLPVGEVVAVQRRHHGGGPGLLRSGRAARLNRQREEDNGGGEPTLRADAAL